MDYRKMSNRILSFVLAFTMVVTPMLSMAEIAVAEADKESEAVEEIQEDLQNDVNEEDPEGTPEEIPEESMEEETKQKTMPSGKTKYAFEDKQIKVIAELSNANAIPDDAEFVATQISKSTKGYNYQAYMDALNKEEKADIYTEDNTILYDFAFMKDEKEIQPEKGSVSVNVEFKGGQLTKELEADKASDIKVTHLPLDASVRESVDTTREATDINVNDIKVEEITDGSNGLNVNVEEQKVTFETKSFSTFAYTTAEAANDGSITVNVNFKDKKGNAASPASLDAEYYLYIKGKADRGDGQMPESRIYKKIDSISNGVASITIDKLGANGSAVGPMIDGDNYEIGIYRLKTENGKTAPNQYSSNNPDQNDFETIANGSFIKAGGKTYSLAISDAVTLQNGTIELEATEAEDPNAVHYGDTTDKISIVNINTVLGRAVEYGILADTYKQTVHTETNWAVITYDRTDSGLVTDPDLATNTEDPNDTGYPFIMANMTNGFSIGNTTKGTMAVYVSDKYAGRDELFSVANPAEVTIKKYFRDEEVLTSDVRSMIQKITDESDNLAAKNTVTVPDAAIPSNNFTLDLTSYADDDVVYVSVPAGSKLEQIIQITADDAEAGKGGLTIKKKANQMVVFNLESKGTVNINKIAVEVDGKRITSDTINQVLDNEHNKDVDNYIIRKIIWNANQAEKLNVDMGAGMFLVPRGDAHCQNASAGWLATGGTVTANGEWHFAFRERQFKTDGSIKFEGRKELRVYKDDGSYTRLPIHANDFKFTLYKTDESYDTTSESSSVVQQHLGNSATSAVQFQDLNIKEEDLNETDDQGRSCKTFYYVVREELPDGTVPALHSEQSVDGVDYWTGALNVKIVATLIEAADGSGGENEIQFTVSSIKTDSDGRVIARNDNIVATTQVFTFGALPNATSDQKVRLMAKKNLVGKTWREDLEFEFKLTPIEATDADGNTIPVANIPMPSSDTAKASHVQQAAVFGAIEYDTPGIYKYKIQEQAPSGAEPVDSNHVKYNNITYDLTPHTATVTVSQEGDVLTTDIKYDENKDDLVITNTAVTGGLIINKIVVSNAQADKNQNFQFRVELSDTSINGTYGEMTFVDGVAEVTVMGDHHKEAEGLPVGITYTVTELPTDGYTTTSEGATGTIAVNKPQANFRNTSVGNLKVTKEWDGLEDSEISQLTPEQKEGLTFVVKDSNQNVVRQFTYADFTGSDYVVENLRVGNYTVVERGADTLDINGKSYVETTYNVEDGEVAVSHANTSEVTVTNTYSEEEEFGKITVNKALGSGAPDEAKTKSYEFTVMKKGSNPAQYVQEDGRLGADPHKFTVQVGTPKTIENMPLGDYVVTEDQTSAAITGYSLAVSEEGDVTATKSGETKTITNTYTEDKGSLTVTKTWEGDDEKLTQAQKNAVSFTVEGPNNYKETFTYGQMTNGSKTLDDLSLGEYTVTESNTNVDGFTISTVYKVGDSETGTAVISSNGDSKTVDVTNNVTELKGKLVLTKSWTGDTSELTDEYKNAIEFTVTGPNNYSKTIKFSEFTDNSYEIDNLTPGEYTVVESNESLDDYVVTKTYKVGDKTTNTIDLTQNGGAVNVTNDYNKQEGELTVTKTWSGDDDKLTTVQKNDVTFTVTGPNNYNETFTYGDMTDGSKKLEHLPLGDYTVTESNASYDGFTVKTEYSVADGKTEIKDGENSTVTVTNDVTQLKGKLVLTKSWTGDTSELTDEYKNAIEFTVTGPNNYSKTIKFSEFTDNSYELSDLTPGLYRVVENNESLAGYEVTKTYKVGNEETGTIQLTYQGGEVNVTNDYNKLEGELTVTKTWSGDHDKLTKAQKDAVTFTVTGPEGFKTQTFTYGDMTDGSKKLEHLPLGEYTVTESNASYEGFTVTKSYSVKDGKVDIKDGDKKSVEVTNAVRQDKGSLTVTKTWEGDDEKLTQAQKNAVTFTVTGPNNYKETFTYGQMTNGSKTLSDLIVGDYTVTESNTNVDGFVISTVYKVGDSETGTAKISEHGENKTVEVTNNVTQLKGKLVLTKSWTGDTSDLTADYKNAIEFTVTGPENYSKTIKFSEFTDNSYELSDLTPGPYKVVESNESLDDYVVTKTYKVGDKTTDTIDLTQNGGAVNVTNDYNKQEGELTVTKTWSGDDDKLTTAQKNAVTFTVTGPNNYNETFTYGDMTDGSKKLEHLPLGDYTVTESNASYDGFTVKTEYSVADGKTEIKDGDAKVVEVSNAVTENKGSFKLKKNVTVNGEAVTADDYKLVDGNYTFKLYKVEDTEETWVKTITLTIENGKSKETEVDELDAGSYVVEEIVPENPKFRIMGGSSRQNVTVTPSGIGTVPTVEFTNNYAHTSIELEGTKTLQNGDIKNHPSFEFSLYDKAEFEKSKDQNIILAALDPLKPVSTAASDDKGQFQFDKIEYTLDDLKTDNNPVTEKTFEYVAIENVPDTAVEVTIDGEKYFYDKEMDVLYDPSEIDVKVKVTYDPKTGEMTAVTQPESINLDFVNKKMYTKLSLTKTIDKFIGEDTDGEYVNATLVFRLTYDDPVTGEKGKIREVSVQFDKENVTSQTIEVDKIPIDTAVEVKEIYSSNYRPGDTVTATKEKDEYGYPIWTASIDNTQVGSTTGSGIINNVDKNEDGGYEWNVGEDPQDEPKN